MALSWNEIKDRALAFSREWATESSEDAEAKSFWDGFFNVFGVNRKRVAIFEQSVRKQGDKQGYIDLLWKGVILVEHKSRGRDLDKAYQQARDYFPGIKEDDLPKYILVSDFARFRLYDLETGAGSFEEFPLADLYKKVRLFGFMAGYQKQTVTAQDPVNIKAVEKLGKLHDELAASGYGGHPLEVLLVRLLFCLFAEDTTIFDPGLFREFIDNKTSEDGNDLGSRLTELFQILNTPEAERQSNLDHPLAAFPYVNGRLYDEFLRIPQFNRKMRDALLECCTLNWALISPAIFGSLFQSVMSGEKRREQGAHYTTEENILKLIGPLFLDDLKAEFEKIKNSKAKLEEFHTKLATLKFLDPACGCGNFLVIAYREIRKIELEILKKLYGERESGFLDAKSLVWCDVDQFYGIELDEFPARIAEVAMWLMDHQMNMAVSEQFGQYFRRLPLKKAATIRNGNALRIDWASVIEPAKLSFILGNPPFGGFHLLNDDQKQDLAALFGKVDGAGVLDYVAAWYMIAARYIQGTNIQCAFVSTNSIVQGEQVGILWKELMERFHIAINFAHRTFRWSSEARGKAAVHCVIVGFAKETGNPSPGAGAPPSPRSRGSRGEGAGGGADSSATSPRERSERGEVAPGGAGEGRIVTRKKLIFDYETPQAEPHRIEAKNINPYLVDAPNVFIEKRRKPICDVPEMIYGSKPADGGFLLLEDEEKKELLMHEPAAKPFIKQFLSAKEFLHNELRWCIWLDGVTPEKFRSLPAIMQRIVSVRNFRAASKKASTQDLAETPYLFAEPRQPGSDYLLIPRHSSENRKYIPFGFFHKDQIVADSCSCVPNATLYEFGVMSSVLHMAWVEYVCGRIKSDYRYSNSIVYNNFPWPEKPSDKAKAAIEAAAQAVLDARAAHKGASLAALYDPLTMPPDLLKAHRALDKTVDAAYGKRPFTTDADRVAFLFERYLELTKAPLESLVEKPKRKSRKPLA